MSGPGGYNFERVNAGGMPGLNRTIQEIKRLIVEGTRDFDHVRRSALEITRGCEPYDHRAQIEAIYNWVRTCVPFRNDPLGFEMLETPQRALAEVAENYGFGTDCDGLTILISSLAESLGHPARLVVIGTTSPAYSHIYPEILDRNSGIWLACDAASPPGNGFGESYPNPSRVTRLQITDRDRVRFGQVTRAQPLEVVDLTEEPPGVYRQSDSSVDWDWQAISSRGRSGELVQPSTPEVDAPDWEMRDAREVTPADAGGLFQRPDVIDIAPDALEDDEYSVDIAPDALEDDEDSVDIWIDVATDDAKGKDAADALPDARPHEAGEMAPDEYSVDIDPEALARWDLPESLVKEIISTAQIGGTPKAGQVPMKAGALLATIGGMNIGDALAVTGSLVPAQSNAFALAAWDPIKWLAGSWLGKLIRKVINQVNDILSEVLGEELGGKIVWLYTRVLINLAWHYSGYNPHVLLALEIMVDDVNGVKEWLNYKVSQIAMLNNLNIEDEETPEGPDEFQEAIDGFERLYNEAKKAMEEVFSRIEPLISEARAAAEKAIAEARDQLQPLIDAGGDLARDAFEQLADIEGDALATFERAKSLYESEIAAARDTFDQALASGAAYIEAFSDKKVREAATEWFDTISALETQASEEITELQSDLMNKVNTGMLTAKEAGRQVEALEKDWSSRIDAERDKAEKAIQEVEKEAKRLAEVAERAAREFEKLLAKNFAIFLKRTGYQAQKALNEYLAMTGRAGWLAVTEYIRTIKKRDPIEFLSEKGISGTQIKAMVEQAEAIFGYNLSMSVTLSVSEEDGEYNAFTMLEEYAADPANWNSDIVQFWERIKPDVREKMRELGVIRVNRDGTIAPPPGRRARQGERALQFLGYPLMYPKSVRVRQSLDNPPADLDPLQVTQVEKSKVGLSTGEKVVGGAAAATGLILLLRRLL